MAVGAKKEEPAVASDLGTVKTEAGSGDEEKVHPPIAEHTPAKEEESKETPTPNSPDAAANATAIAAANGANDSTLQLSEQHQQQMQEQQQQQVLVPVSSEDGGTTFVQYAIDPRTNSQIQVRTINSVPLFNRSELKNCFLKSWSTSPPTRRVCPRARTSPPSPQTAASS